MVKNKSSKSHYENTGGKPGGVWCPWSRSPLSPCRRSPQLSRADTPEHRDDACHGGVVDDDDDDDDDDNEDNDDDDDDDDNEDSDDDEATSRCRWMARCSGLQAKMSLQPGHADAGPSCIFILILMKPTDHDTDTYDTDHPTDHNAVHDADHNADHEA